MTTGLARNAALLKGGGEGALVDDPAPAISSWRAVRRQASKTLPNPVIAAGEPPASSMPARAAMAIES